MPCSDDKNTKSFLLHPQSYNNKVNIVANNGKFHKSKQIKYGDSEDTNIARNS